MEIQRTANAGVLLKLDGVSILLDGLCHNHGPYLGTPAKIAENILRNSPDLLAFTHGHSDHFGESLVSQYCKQNLRPILGPESLPYTTEHSCARLGAVEIKAIPTRHLGRADVAHQSYLITGSRRVLFAGDASPLQLKGRDDMGHIDLLIAPYAYANTASSWARACAIADAVVLVHLPDRQKDEYHLWQQVADTAGDQLGKRLYIPQIGELLHF